MGAATSFLSGSILAEQHDVPLARVQTGYVSSSKGNSQFLVERIFLHRNIRTTLKIFKSSSGVRNSKGKIGFIATFDPRPVKHHPYLLTIDAVGSERIGHPAEPRTVLRVDANLSTRGREYVILDGAGTHICTVQKTIPEIRRIAYVDRATPLIKFEDECFLLNDHSGATIYICRVAEDVTVHGPMHKDFKRLPKDVQLAVRPFGTSPAVKLAETSVNFWALTTVAKVEEWQADLRWNSKTMAFEDFTTSFVKGTSQFRAYQCLQVASGADPLLFMAASFCIDDCLLISQPEQHPWNPGTSPRPHLTSSHPSPSSIPSLNSTPTTTVPRALSDRGHHDSAGRVCSELSASTSKPPPMVGAAGAPDEATQLLWGGGRCFVVIQSNKRPRRFLVYDLLQGTLFLLAKKKGTRQWRFWNKAKRRSGQVRVDGSAKFAQKRSYFIRGPKGSVEWAIHGLETTKEEEFSSTYTTSGGYPVKAGGDLYYDIQGSADDNWVVRSCEAVLEGESTGGLDANSSTGDVVARCMHVPWQSWSTGAYQRKQYHQERASGVPVMHDLPVIAVAAGVDPTLMCLLLLVASPEHTTVTTQQYRLLRNMVLLADDETYLQSAGGLELAGLDKLYTGDDETDDEEAENMEHKISPNVLEVVDIDSDGDRNGYPGPRNVDCEMDDSEGSYTSGSGSDDMESPQSRRSPSNSWMGGFQTP